MTSARSLPPIQRKHQLEKCRFEAVSGHGSRAASDEEVSWLIAALAGSGYLFTSSHILPLKMPLGIPTNLFTAIPLSGLESISLFFSPCP